jgi:hypothetical protein
MRRPRIGWNPRPLAALPQAGQGRRSGRRQARLASPLLSVAVLAGCTSSGGHGATSAIGAGTAGAVSVSSTGSASVAAAGPSACVRLSQSTQIRRMSNALADAAAGSASSADQKAISAAVTQMRAISRAAPGVLAARLDDTARAISTLTTDTRPTRSSLKTLVGAFADLDRQVRTTCHFPLR